MALHEKLGPGDGLLVVHVQRDFCPGGALPVPEGDQVVPVLNRWIEAAGKAGAKVFASRDWHPPGHVSFREQGGHWPPHAVANSPGAQFHQDLKLPTDAIVVSTGYRQDADEYSAFQSTDLADLLRRAGVKRLFVGGLALEVCVRASVLDAIKHGFEVHVILDATRAINERPDDGVKAVEEMARGGAVIEPVTPEDK